MGGTHGRSTGRKTRVHRDPSVLDFSDFEAYRSWAKPQHLPAQGSLDRAFALFVLGSGSRIQDIRPPESSSAKATTRKIAARP